MWAGKVFKLVVRPLSALSLVVPMLGVLGAVALAAATPASAETCPNEACRTGPRRPSPTAAPTSSSRLARSPTSIRTFMTVNGPTGRLPPPLRRSAATSAVGQPVCDAGFQQRQLSTWISTRESSAWAQTSQPTEPAGRGAVGRLHHARRRHTESVVRSI